MYQVKIWDDRKALPLAVLKPHDGVPVNSVTFLTAPHRPEHIVLITAVYASYFPIIKNILTYMSGCFSISLLCDFGGMDLP